MKSLTKILGTLIVPVTLMSCTEIYFSEPQPKGIDPLDNGFEEIIGEYVSLEEDGEKDDTVIITKDEIIFPDEDDMDGELSEDVIVKKYKGRYFLNFRAVTHCILQLGLNEKLNKATLGRRKLPTWVRS